jgi:hypothetical protein
VYDNNIHLHSNLQDNHSALPLTPNPNFALPP